MSNFSQSYLEELKMRASGAVSNPSVPMRLEARYEQAHDIYVELGDGNLRDWVTQEYREWYQDWKNDERGPPCNCSDCGCPLKNGSLPYIVRKHDSVFSERTLPPTDDRIKEFLDQHPEAVALSESMQELREKRLKCERLFEQVIRDTHRAKQNDDEDPREREREAHV